MKYIILLILLILCVCCYGNTPITNTPSNNNNLSEDKDDNIKQSHITSDDMLEDLIEDTIDYDGDWDSLNSFEDEAKSSTEGLSLLQTSTTILNKKWDYFESDDSKKNVWQGRSWKVPFHKRRHQYSRRRRASNWWYRRRRHHSYRRRRSWNRTRPYWIKPKSWSRRRRSSLYSKAKMNFLKNPVNDGLSAEAKKLIKVANTIKTTRKNRLWVSNKNSKASSKLKTGGYGKHLQFKNTLRTYSSRRRRFYGRRRRSLASTLKDAYHKGWALGYEMAWEEGTVGQRQ